MKPQLLTSIAAFTLGLACLPLAVPSLSFAQGSGAADPTISTSIEVSNADVRTALRELFKTAGASYKISPDVQGEVTMSMKNVPFSVALQSLVRQVGATYNLRNGVYEISKGDEKIGSGDINTPVTIDLNNEDVRKALSVLCKTSGVSYRIAPEVQGAITLSAKNVPFTSALQSVVQQVGATYKVRDGVYEIVRTEGQSGAVEAPAPRSIPQILSQTPAESQTAITQDNRFLYIVTGDRIMKVRKDNLDVVAVKSLPSSRAIIGGGRR